MTRFEWERAMLASESLASTTRLVLLTIGTHADNAGAAFPSIRTLVAETNLSNRTIIDHINLAVGDGWLRRAQIKDAGRAWKRSVYHLCTSEGGEGRSPASPEGGEPASPRQSDQGGEPGSRGGERRSNGGEPDDIKVVKEVHSNTSLNISMNNREQRERAISSPLALDFRPSLDEVERTKTELQNRGIDVGNFDAWHLDVVTKFVAHHRGKGTRSRDWSATWQGWMVDQYRIEAERGQKANGTSKARAAGHILPTDTDYGQTGAIQ